VERVGRDLHGFFGFFANKTSRVGLGWCAGGGWFPMKLFGRERVEQKMKKQSKTNCYAPAAKLGANDLCM
jgi:hypothetical protein